MNSKSVLHTIKWSDHKNEIFAEQQYLFDNSLECDCILISAEGRPFQAHQMVLSSSSGFFHKILNDIPPLIGSPTIQMPDAESCVLESILKFVYTGETAIASSYLTSFLEFCNILNIKGCVANGFTLNGSTSQSENDTTESGVNVSDKNLKSESWTSEEYLVLPTEVGSCEEDNETTENNEPDYLEEYLDDDASFEVKDEETLDADFDRNDEFISIEIDNPTVQVVKRQTQPGTLSSSSDIDHIDEALSEIHNGKTIHQLSLEYNLPRSTLYHRFRNNANLKQKYRSQRKSALDSAVHAVLEERFSLKAAADRYKLPKTAIWREVRKFEQYQPSAKEITWERQSAQLEIISGKSLTSISAKYGIPLTTLHRDKKKLSLEGKLPESFRVRDRTENSEYGQRLEMALKKCKSGMSQYQAAKLYNIPKATMWRYANALNKSTRKSKTKPDDEQQQVDT